MKLTALCMLAAVVSTPALAQDEWYFEGPNYADGGAYCMAISPQDLGLRINTEGSGYDIAFFKVPVSNLTLLDLKELEKKDIWALVHAEGIYTAYIKAMLGPVEHDAEGNPIVGIFMFSGDFHLYDALRSAPKLRAIVGEGFEFSFDIDTVPGKIFEYSLAGSSGAIGKAEDCIKGATTDPRG
jgi:hypothetical protein